MTRVYSLELTGKDGLRLRLVRQQAGVLAPVSLACVLQDGLPAASESRSDPGSEQSTQRLTRPHEGMLLLAPQTGLGIRLPGSLLCQQHWWAAVTKAKALSMETSQC